MVWKDDPAWFSKPLVALKHTSSDYRPQTVELDLPFGPLLFLGVGS